ncbi:hypothetical protein JQX13_35625 [Archangium violaceum]|uniref:hypothetical protein n=1 Tax=Archangium violaceum TaxID=83451 RepID=UPI00193C4CE3|nr:hypothetical protein [Archangium violaceum]QRK05467.1 hypothetical protein JQX13_35625 [Archangium violaceum]
MPNKLYEEPTQLFSLTLAKEGLTFVQDDLGPEDARRPLPVLHPQGLWLFDRGPDDRTLRLLAYDLSGHRLGVYDLVARLGLTAPGEFLVATASVDAHGTLRLLASRRFNASAMKMEDFVLVGVSPKGELTSVKELPGFQYDGTAFIEGESVLNLERGEGTAATWVLYQEGKRRTLTGSTWGRQIIRVDGGVLEAPSSPSARFLRISDGTHAAIKAAGAPGPGLIGIPGRGDIFGVEQRASYTRPPEGEWYQQERTGKAFFFARKTGEVLPLGSSPLPANRVRGQAGQDFVVQLLNQSFIDEQGRLYEIAWTPTSLRVLRHEMTPRERERLPKP